MNAFGSMRLAAAFIATMVQANRFHAILHGLRARWLWDDRDTTAQRQQHPVKPQAAEPAY
jgi:hypothetical protein